jgi:hypothetical protein
MLTVFWDIRGVIQMNWFYDGVSFSGTCFEQEILQVMAAEFQGE